MKKIWTSFKTHWYLYCGWVIVVALICVWIFPLLTKTPSEQKFSVFVGSYTDDISAFRAPLDENKPDYIKQLDVYSYKLDDAFYDLSFAAYGPSYSDIVIVPESAIAQSDISENFALLDPSEFTGCEYYTHDEKVYGIVVYNKDTDKSQCSGLSFTKENKERESYIMLISKRSEHIGEEHNGATVLAKVILGL